MLGDGDLSQWLLLLEAPSALGPADRGRGNQGGDPEGTQRGQGPLWASANAPPHLKDDEGIDCGRDRALRLMREMGIKSTQSKRFKPLKTNSNHPYGYSPNVLKKHGQPTHIDEVWVADTTYL